MRQFAVAVSIACIALLANADLPENIRETVPASEASDISEIVEIAKANVRKDYAKDAQGIARRDAHAKAHGCVGAQFEVKNNLPANLKVGIFSAPKTYDAIIRFSNGNPRVQDDHEGDGRGMAIKLIGANRGGDQDFLMINHPVFFVKDTDDYVKFNRAASRGSMLFLAKYFLGGFHFREFGIVRDIQKKKISSVLKERYFSMTPYTLGNQAVKYSARPCKALPALPAIASNDYLRLDLGRRLAADAACFEFGVQLRTKPGKMPIEDSTTEWLETDSPFITVATVTIPSQVFDTPDTMASCENMSYSPWHAGPEHRPLGNMNRIRKAVYDAVSQLRHELNGTAQ